MISGGLASGFDEWEGSVASWFAEWFDFSSVAGAGLPVDSVNCANVTVAAVSGLCGALWSMGSIVGVGSAMARGFVSWTVAGLRAVAVGAGLTVGVGGCFVECEASAIRAFFRG